jgi:lipopolysaccharide biosynthesis protein
MSKIDERNKKPKARLIAYYLPQYYPTPENDAFWGKGFTEWLSVVKAKPLFRGHYQPHVPADLGFYDLRVPETRCAQAEMARRYGVEAFCYWHYWFAGRLYLQRPLEEVLNSGEPDFPFCVGWANESWTGIWHGLPGRILQEQTYPGENDHIAHFRYLQPFFEDERYFRLDGKPVFLIFKPESIPDLARALELWRKLAKDAGLGGLHFVAYMPDTWSAKNHGFDAVTWAHQSVLKAVKGRSKWRHLRNLIGLPVHAYSYADAVPYMHGPRALFQPLPDDHYPSIVAGWDNSPRAGRAATILHGYTPELFRLHARNVLNLVQHKLPEKRVVFLKSWNEWAEGNYIEPEQRYGLAFLEALRSEVYVGEDEKIVK